VNIIVSVTKNWLIKRQGARQGGENSRKVLCKMFLLFSETLLKRGLSIVEIGKRRLFFDVPPGRFGSSRPSSRRRIVLE
jgi:hypothetical protein